MSTKVNYKSKDELIKEFGKYVNILEGSNVYKQNLVKDVYMFLKWKKHVSLYKNDIFLYIKYLKSVSVSKAEASHIMDSIVIFYGFAVTEKPEVLNILSKTYSDNRFNILKVIKKVKYLIIGILMLLLISGLYVLVES